MNNFTINELKNLKKFIYEQLKINELMYGKYNEIKKELENNNDNNQRKKLLNKMKKDHKLISKKYENFEINDENYLEKTISKIKKYSLFEERWELNRLINHYDDKNSINERNGKDLNINDTNDNQIFFFPNEINLFLN